MVLDTGKRMNRVLEVNEKLGYAVVEPGVSYFDLYNHTTDDRDDRGSHVLHDRHRISTGTPSLEELALMDWIPNGGHLSIAPISTPDGHELLEQVHLLRDLAQSHGRDYCALISLFGKAIIHVFLVMFDTTNDEDKRGALELSKQLVRDAAVWGHGEMRTHDALMDEVAATYSWNDGHCSDSKRSSRTRSTPTASSHRESQESGPHGSAARNCEVAAPRTDGHRRPAALVNGPRALRSQVNGQCS